MSNELKVVEQEAQLQLVDPAAAIQIELGVKLAQTKPRDVEKLMLEVVKSATKNREIAEGCFYALDRDGKTIEGPGVDLAKLLAQKWGNLWIKSDIIRETDKEIFGGAVVWDLETNNVYVGTASRNILYSPKHKTKANQRYSQDMINITGRAAQSVALRNAIFTAIPKADTFEAFREIDLVRTGKKALPGEKQLTLEERVANALKYFKTLGVTQERLLYSLGVDKVEEIDDEQLRILIGFKTAIKDGEMDINELFPPVPRETSKAKSDKIQDSMLPKTSDKDLTN